MTITTSKTFTVSILLFLLNFTLIYSQNYVDHIGTKDGLTSQLCQAIEEDDYGNLWISSFQGVEKFDGYNTTFFELSGTDNRDLPIVDILSDNSGNIWILEAKIKNQFHTHHITPDNHYYITIINPLTNKPSTFDELYGKIVKQEELNYIQEIDGLIFLITNDKRIFYIDEQINLHTDLSTSDAGIYMHDKEKIIKCYPEQIIITNQDNNVIHTIQEETILQYDAFSISNEGHLYFLATENNQIYISQFQDGNITHRISIPKNNIEKKYLKTLSIHQHEYNFFIINHKLYNTEPIRDSEIINTLKERKVFDLLVSKSNLTYFTTNVGIYILNNKSNLFKAIFNYKDDKKTHSVRALYMSKDLTAYKKNEKELIQSPSGRYNLHFLSGVNLGHLATMHYRDPLDTSKFLSSGYVTKGIREIDLDDQEIKYYQYWKKYPPRSNCIHRSSFDSILYIGGSNGLYNLVDGKIHEVNLGMDRINEISINQILEYNDELWLASSLGLIIYNHKIDSFYVKKTGLKNHYLQHIHIDKTDHNIIWLGTRKEGLIKWNLKTNENNYFNDKNGLSQNDVHAILEDKQNRLWISTNQNLNCLDKNKDEIYIFTVKDGISHKEFNKFSFFENKENNQLYFGGLNGYTCFNPDSINTIAIQNNIAIRIIGAQKIKKNATIENLFPQIIKRNDIEFQDDDHTVSIDLSTNYLANNRERNFNYRIQGLFDKWVKISGNTLNLNSLPYGEHTLEIISDPNEPSLTSNIFTIPINVIQPFTKTWTFAGLMLMAGLLIIWLGTKLYLKNIHQRNLKLEEIVRERTQELSELNKTKNKIFTILAHDLRNPINSLSNIAEKTRFLARHNRLEEIDFLTEQTESKLNALNDNLNNILLWSLRENKMLILEPENYSLLLEIRKVLNIYSSQIEEKKLEISMDLKDVDQVYIDIKILQAILRNFITNAIKFSYTNGKIEFTKNKITEDRIELMIEDKGIGILEKKSILEKSPERNIRAEGQGSGIGLKISLELSKLAGVNIDIKSEPGHGTKVLVDFRRSTSPIQ